jgi:hypothetical protein
VRFDNRSGWLLPLALIAVLIAVPASWATGEEAKGKDSTGSAEDAKTSEADEDEKKKPVRCVDGKPLSSFNTVEDIEAHDGPSESLLEPPVPTDDSAPKVAWRKVQDPATEKTEETSSDDED